MINPAHRGFDSEWCTFVRERAELFLDGELYGSENLAFVTHLKECEECAEWWAKDETLSRRLMVGIGAVEPVLPEARPAGSARPTKVTTPAPMSMMTAPTPKFRRELLVLSLAAIGFLGVVYGGRMWWKSTNEPMPLETAVADAADPVNVKVMLARGRPLARPTHGAAWQAVDRGDDLTAGMEVVAPEGSELVAALADQGSILLSSGAQVRVHCAGSGCDDVSLEVVSGRVTGDITGRSFLVACEEAAVSGWSAAFSVEAVPPDARGRAGALIVVTRGMLTARSGSESRTLSAGQSIGATCGAFRESPTADDAVRAAKPEAERLNQVEAELVSARTEIARLRGDLDRARVAGEAAEQSPADILAEYLLTVERSGHVDVDKPNGFARAAVEKLGAFGPGVASAVLDAFLAEPSAQKREALLVVMAGIGGPIAVDGIIKGSADVAEDVRAASVCLLMKNDDPALAAHLLTVARHDEAAAVRGFAAFAAAKKGADEGIEVLTNLYFSTGEYCIKSRAFHFLLKLADRREARAFLEGFVRDWRVGDNVTMLRQVVRKIDEIRDVEALPHLRELAERQGLPQDVDRMVDELIARLGVVD